MFTDGVDLFYASNTTSAHPHPGFNNRNFLRTSVMALVLPHISVTF